MVIFHSYVNVYQRVDDLSKDLKPLSGRDAMLSDEAADELEVRPASWYFHSRSIH